MTSSATSVSIHKLDLFEFVKVLLTDKQRYAKCTDALKASHFFMTQRMLSKGYPIQVNKANINGIDVVAVLDTYHSMLCNDGGYPPKWLYAKTAKEQDSDQNKLYNEIVKSSFYDELMNDVFAIEHKELRNLIDANFSYVLQQYVSLKEAYEGKGKRTKTKSKKLI